MNRIGGLFLAAGVALASGGGAQAATVWADAVIGYSAGIIDHDTNAPMDDKSKARLLGAPDGEEMGWKAWAAGDWLTVGFSTGLFDKPGDDLTIRMYSGPNSGANVFISSDNLTFTQIGTLGAGEPHVFRDETFDFTGFADPVHYVKVEKTTAAGVMKSGMFFDAFGGAPTPVPLPASALLLLAAVAALTPAAMRARRAA